MELIYYKQKIEKVNELYIKEKNKRNLILILLSFTSFILFIFLLLSIIYEIMIMMYICLSYIILRFVSFILAAIYFSKNFTYKRELELLIMNILQDNNYQISSPCTNKEYIKNARSSPFISKYDSISLKYAFRTVYDDYTINAYELDCYRSTGKSAYPVLNGLVVDLEFSTQYNIFLKCNNFQKENYKSRKLDTDGKNKTYIFKPKCEIANGPDDILAISKKFNELNGLKTGIAYTDTYISFYLERKHKKDKFKTINEEVIKSLIDVYLSDLELINKNLKFLKESINA